MNTPHVALDYHCKDLKKNETHVIKDDLLSSLVQLLFTVLATHGALVSTTEILSVT